MDINFTLAQILEIVGERDTEGETTAVISGIASLKEAREGDLSFLTNEKYKKDVINSHASIIFLPKNFEGTPKKNQLFLRGENVSWMLALLCEHIEKGLFSKPRAGIHHQASVDPAALVDPTVWIGPFCVVQAGARIAHGSILDAQVFVGENASVGRDCHLMAHVTVNSYCVLADRVRLQPGVVIGSDGFGYTTIKGKHLKEPQIGNVVIEDDVEIGANSTVDRARFHETRIKKGTKIDNLVHIAHNVHIGKNCLIAAQAGIAGSTIVEDSVMTGGQSGIGGHIRIGEGAILAGQAIVVKDLAQRSFVRGIPANPIHLENKIIVLKKRLPDLFKRVARLEEMLQVQEK
jgi:UDP-3-O-[3-hydroxymyristoyl] glucosamine N-acyltransferase